jgi:hypothetical protein
MAEQVKENTKRILIIGILAVTVALAGIAIFTAIKLYQLGQEVAPSPKPKERAEVVPEVFQLEDVCQLSFTVSPSGSPSPSPSASPSPSPSASPSPGAPVCYQGECTTNPDNCPSGLDCQNINGNNLCVNPSCRDESDCECAQASPSPSPSASPSYQCWNQCDYNYQCPSDLECLEVNGVNRCVNPTCRTDSDCSCAQAQGSPSPRASASPGITYVPGQSPPPPQRELPQAGSLSPTLLFTLGGLALVGLGLLL